MESGGEGFKQGAVQAGTGQLERLRRGCRGGTCAPSSCGKLGEAGTLLDLGCCQDVLRQTLGSSEIPFSEKTFLKQFEIFKKMDFGGRNAFEQIEHISRVSANKAAALKFADFLSVFCVNMGGRVADRLQLEDIFRCYFDSNLPHILTILETQTTFRNKIPDLPGYQGYSNNWTPPLGRFSPTSL